MSSAGISAQSLRKSFRTRGKTLNVLTDATAEFPAGAVSVITGPSGSGKSTLLLILGALLHPDGGTATICGEDLWHMSAARRSRLRPGLIGFVFQRFHLVPYLTVEQNIAAAAVALDGPSDPARCGALIDLLGLRECRDHRPGELSVGEQQRTALARALHNRPKVLFADEPTGNLDDANAAIVMATLVRFAAAGGTVVMATHSASAAEHADVAVRMETGRLIVNARGQAQTQEMP
jgi:putative ABC transport system ATP-binding protein